MGPTEWALASATGLWVWHLLRVPAAAAPWWRRAVTCVVADAWATAVAGWWLAAGGGLVWVAPLLSLAGVLAWTAARDVVPHLLCAAGHHGEWRVEYESSFGTVVARFNGDGLEALREVDATVARLARSMGRDEVPHRLIAACSVCGRQPSPVDTDA